MEEAALILSIACRNYRILSIIKTLCGQLGFIEFISENVLYNLSSKLLTLITSIFVIFIVCVCIQGTMHMCPSTLCGMVHSN